MGDILAHDASWSPNGEQIVYARGNELYLAKPDGSESRRLVTLTGPASWPRWSPDGKILRFTMDDSKSGSQSVGSGLGRDPLASLVARLEQSAGRVLRQLDSGWELLCFSIATQLRTQVAFGLFGKKVDFYASATRNQHS